MELQKLVEIVNTTEIVTFQDAATADEALALWEAAL
jgi:hypothetical protein